MGNSALTQNTVVCIRIRAKISIAIPFQKRSQIFFAGSGAVIAENLTIFRGMNI